MKPSIIPTGRELAHQVLVTVGVALVLWAVASAFPGLRTWWHQQDDA